VPVGEVPAADLDRRGGGEVGGEHPRSRDRATIRGRNECEIGLAGRLDPAGDPGGFESIDRSHAHGMSPNVGSPVVSGRPSTQFAA
jgi:hypothetical protein